MSPIKIGIAGTHSTGKSSFLATLETRLVSNGLRVGRVNDLAAAAQGKGFPILASHTFESTLWIMASGMAQEAEASLQSDVILVDRPVFDALGYLEAALEITSRAISPERLRILQTIAREYGKDYTILVATVLDPEIALGAGRDPNETFRTAAAKHIERLTSEIAPSALRLTSDNVSTIVDRVVSQIEDGRVKSR